MKRIAFILLACIIMSACTKQGSDLETVTLKEDVGILIKDHKKSTDKLEMLTALPGYLVTDVDGYSWGPVDVPPGSSVEFLLNSLTERKLVGLDVTFKTDTTSKLITSYLFKKYGKPQTLQDEQRIYDIADNAYRSSAAYLWRNVKPGISMVLLNKNEEINKEPWHTSELIVLKNDVTPQSPLNSGTSLDRVINNYSPLE